MPVRTGLLFILVIFGITACSDSPPGEAGISLQQALGGTADARYLRADAPRAFSFPADHGLHEGFRNEWWYLTGNLQAEDGQHFAYQLTFFYQAQPPGTAVTTQSTWYSERVWMAHLALTDVAGNKHYAFERFSRENPALAGAQLQPFKVWLEDWQLGSVSAASVLPWKLSASTSEAGLALTLSEGKAPVLQGDKGWSKKSATAGNASYYYSMTRLPTAGEITVADKVYKVSGASWLDREWSTSALDADQSGWDWFSLQFDDGQELMYYQLRNNDGSVHPYSSGNWTDTEARQTSITREEITLEAVSGWTSASGITYTTQWLLRYRNKTWRIKAVLQNQLMDLTIPYWEGAVTVQDESNAAQVGQGFVEMVR